MYSLFVIYKIPHNSTTNENKRLQCKNLRSIRQCFVHYLSDRPNEVIATSFNGCQKLCFTLVAPIRTKTTRCSV